jgi:SAM-dependent methyltransferase
MGPPDVLAPANGVRPPGAGGRLTLAAVQRDRIRDAYDALAPVFAERNAAVPPGVAAAAERFLAGLGPGARVLDLGCGHGRDAAWMAARGVAVVGADLSPGMLAQARDRTRAPLVECDMRVLPFADGTFAGVWCNAALLHLPRADAPAALVAIRAVLVPGGLLYVAIQEGDEESWEPATWVEGAARFFARYRAPEFERLLQQAGFAPPATDAESVPGRTWLRFLARRAD